MSNIRELESINSVCTTSEELIKSEDFIRGVTIILEKVKTFNKDYILSLFTKLQSGEDLDNKEREDLNSFVTDAKVARLGQELLSKLGNVPVNVKTNNKTELASFSELLNNIFAKNGFKKVQSYVGEVVKIADLTLDEYEGMKKIKIEVNGEEKEVYMDEANLRVDSSEWKEKEIADTKVKINQEGDITEYLEGELAGEQLFTWDAAMREAQKQGKRLPANWVESKAIVNKVGIEEFGKKLPGFRDGDVFFSAGDQAFFWFASTDGDYRSAPEVGNYADFMFLTENDHRPLYHFEDRANGFSVRCIKDIN